MTQQLTSHPEYSSSFLLALLTVIHGIIRKGGVVFSV